MAQQIQLRNGTAADWIISNPILASGEAGVEVDTFKVKYGNGLLNWVDLPYATGGGSGTVTSVSVATANGVSGSVANPTTTPAITLTLGAITPSSILASGTVGGSNLSGTNTGDQTITLTGDVTGTGTGSFAATLVNTGVTATSYTNANITVDSKGRITSASNGTAPVTSVSVTTANGVSGSVTNPTSTPAITLTLGAITPTSVAATGTVTGSNLSGVNTGDQTITLTGDVTGTGTGSFAATLANTGVTSGSYIAANVTVDSKGRITSAASGLTSGQVNAVSTLTLTPSAAATALSAATSLIPSGLYDDGSAVYQALSATQYIPAGTDVYNMPQPTGVNDDAALTAALASTKTVILFQRGTYIFLTNQTGVTNRIFMGMGRDITTLKLANNANLTSILSPASNATNIQIMNLTYDGNASNQTGGRGALIDLSTTNVTSNIVIDNCRITNTYSSDGIGVIGSSNFRITNNLFIGTTVVALRLDGCVNGIVSNNYFSNWNATGSQSCIWLLNPGVTKNITIASNRFLNVIAGAFCIESIKTASVSGLTLSVAAQSGGTQVISGTNSTVQSAFPVGHVMRIAAGLSTASLFRDLLITASTSTTVTVQVLDGGTLTVETGTAAAGIVSSTYHTGINISNNLMDGGGLRGTGVSGFFSNSVIAGNVLVNGADVSGTNAFWRNGFELFGENTTVENNFIQNGGMAISADSANSYPNSIQNKVVNNTILINSSVSTSFLALQFNNQDDFLLSGNNIQITLSGSATLTGAIGVGVYGASGTLNRALISENNVKLIGTTASTGIRNLSSTSTDVDIRGNVVTNFSSGIGLQSNSNDTNLRVLFNNVWNNTTPISGVPTGTGYMNQANITSSGQTSLGFPVVLTSAALAALTTGTLGVQYIVTDGPYRGTAYQYDATSNTFFPVGTSPTQYGYA